ncbi:MAG TPA: cytochrome c oxidase assembly protein [Gaiellaceae bacterium]|nr:cytochrome c oxidase assembly protein [Gaiellaceae bacterium]
MHPGAWPISAEAVAGIPIVVCAYVAAQRRYPSSTSRRLAFLLAVALLAVAFATPVQTIAVHYLLSAHLFQNVVTAEWASGLTVVAIAPALAERLERSAGVRALTHPLVALPMWLATYYAWHVPWIYDAALRHPHSLLHVEHVTYFAAGMLMWWPVVHGRWNDGVKALYLFGAFVLASPLGLLLALLPDTVYAFYEHAPHLWIGHLTDQQIAGMTMAVEEAVVFFGAFALYLTRFLRHEAIVGVFTESRR